MLHPDFCPVDPACAEFPALAMQKAWVVVAPGSQA
jgi:hypothetical protein